MNYEYDHAEPVPMDDATQDQHDYETLYIQNADAEFYSDPEHMIATLGHRGLAALCRELHAAAYDSDALSVQERAETIADVFRFWADRAFCQYLDEYRED